MYLTTAIAAPSADELSATLTAHLNAHADAALAPYRGVLHRLARTRAPVRSPEGEARLAQIGGGARIPGDAFVALDNADLDDGTIPDAAGATLPLTRARDEGRRELLGAGACAPGSW